MTSAAQFRSGMGSGPVYSTGPGNFSLNGTGIAVAYIVQARTTDAITHIRVRYGARTGTPPTYVVTIEGVGTDGKPNGTDKGGGSPTAVTFTPPASTAWNGTVQEFALTNSYAPAAKDEWLAITIRYSSGTCDASNFSSCTRSWGNILNTELVHMPNTATLSGGAWTISNTAYPPIAWRTASRTYGRCPLNVSTVGTANAAGYKSGYYFTIPAGFGATYQIRALSLIAGFGAVAKAAKLAIWDTAGTELQSVTIDTDQTQNVTTARIVTGVFATPSTLTYGTKYRCGLEYIDTNCNAYAIDLDAAADATEFPNGANMGGAVYGASGWVESALHYPLLELEWEDSTAAAGGGAGSIVIGNSGSVIRGLI